MKILLQFELSTKIVEITNGDDIFGIIEETYSLLPNSYKIKRFHKEFMEYVDFSDTTTLSDLDKFQIISSPSTSDQHPSTSSISEFSAFLSQDIHIEHKNVTVEVVLDLKKKRWPKKVEIPVEDFSRTLKEALEAKRELTWETSRELIGHLANYCYQYCKYPKQLQRQQICLSLIELYPHLKSTFGLGFGSIETKLRNKLTRLRQADPSVETNIRKKAAEGLRVPKKIKIAQATGALNWAPDHFPGENESTQADHLTALQEESLKEEGCQDKAKIKNVMALTYSFRRADINNKMSVNDMKIKYPVFFQALEQFQEFSLLTSVDIQKEFMLNAISKGSKLFNLFKTKKLSDEQKTFLITVEDNINSFDTLPKRCEAETAYGLMVIPFLFKEPLNSFFQIVSSFNINFNVNLQFQKTYF